MATKHIIDDQEKLLITLCDGEANDKEFIHSLKKYQREIQNDPKYINYNELVNFSEVTSIKISITGLITLSQIASSTDNEQAIRKVALIVSSNVAFGLARMFEVYRSFEKNACKKIRVFRKEHEAYTWLRNNN